MPNNTDILLNDVKEYAVQRAISDLMDEGLDENYIVPMLDIFRNGILNQAKIEDLVAELQQYVLGSDNSKGVLDRYVKQVQSDSLTQFTANYTKVLNENAGYEFYIYLGNEQKDSRCFCKERHGNYYHRKEVEAWGDGRELGSCNIGDGKWAGMISGTNPSNIFTYRGGWNCNHQIVPVLTTMVPKEVINRAIEKGYYVPAADVIKYLDE